MHNTLGQICRKLAIWQLSHRKLFSSNENTKYQIPVTWDRLDIWRLEWGPGRWRSRRHTAPPARRSRHIHSATSSSPTLILQMYLTWSAKVFVSELNPMKGIYIMQNIMVLVNAEVKKVEYYTKNGVKGLKISSFFGINSINVNSGLGMAIS